MQKVSLSHKIPKCWFSQPDTVPKIGSEPGLSEPVSRYILTLLKFQYKSYKVWTPPSLRDPLNVADVQPGVVFARQVTQPLHGSGPPRDLVVQPHPPIGREGEATQEVEVHLFGGDFGVRRDQKGKEVNDYRGENKGLYVVARNVFLLLLVCSAWPCLGPA